MNTTTKLTFHVHLYNLIQNKVKAQTQLFFNIWCFPSE